MSSTPPPFPPQGQPPYPPQPPQGPYGAPPQPPGMYPPPPGYGQPPYGQQPLGYASPNGGPGTGVLCPRCGQYAASRMKFTWWGGVLGPKLLNHHKCAACSHQFNGKTGQSNAAGIAIYTVVGVVIGLVLFFVFFFLARGS
ncbi:MAG: hypothetical protein ACAI43_21610 [Phycisphaerae bacterium]|nr:hypothetical protein [Tepidisphaeraceae bacterium]